MRRKIYTDEKIADAVSKSFSFSEVIAILGAGSGGNSYQRIRQRVDALGLDRSHFTTKWITQNGGQNKKGWDEILVAGKTRREGGKRLRRCLVESGVIYECQTCGLGDRWNEQPLTLHVDHIDGDWTDCRKENLRFLCPNCHTQTLTYGNQTTARRCEDCGKKITKGYDRCARCAGLFHSQERKVKNRPSLATLQHEVDTLGYKGTGRKYNVSDSTIRKWIRIETFKESRGCKKI